MGSTPIGHPKPRNVSSRAGHPLGCYWIRGRFRPAALGVLECAQLDVPVAPVALGAALAFGF